VTETAATEGLDPEDEKLITLARASRARTGAAEGAAVRDETGRTYTAAAVALPSLKLTALQAAVAAAVSSEAGALEDAAIVAPAGEIAGADRAVAADMKTPLVVLAAPDGTPVRALRD